jgi:hypothetical protein
MDELPIMARDLHLLGHRPPLEFAIRGRARHVTDADLRRRAVEAWAFDASEGYRLVELEIGHALLGRRPTADDWPPIHTSWRSDCTERVSRGRSRSRR